MVKYPDADNTYAVMAAACASGGDKLTAGKRRLIQRHWVDFKGKQVEKLTLADEYEWMTYRSFGEAMHHIGCGFVAWAECKPNDCVIIYAETCAPRVARWKLPIPALPRARPTGRRPSLRSSTLTHIRTPLGRAREWMLAAQGAFTQGLTIVTVYATLGEEGFAHGAKQTKVRRTGACHLPPSYDDVYLCLCL
jgi:long-subunit acyl-CoA synthetase (AMP-forming)